MADHRTPDSDRSARSTRVGIRLFVACFSLALLFATPAWSGNLVQVRVGNHPTYTRVVFEFDAPSGYRIERRAPGEPANAIRVTLDAASRARSIVSKSKGVESIEVDPASGRAVAHIMTRKTGLPIREMILNDPPRVVLDLMISDAEPAAKSEGAKATAKAKPAQPEPAVPEAQPEPILAEPEEVAATAPEAQPAEPAGDAVSEPLIEVPEMATPEDPAPYDAIAAADQSVAEAEVLAEAAAEAAVEDPTAALTAEDADEVAAEAAAEAAATAPEAAAPLAVIDMADLMGGKDAIEPDAQPEIPEPPAARESARTVSPVPDTEVADEAASLDWKRIGMIAAAALPLLLLVGLVIRSRRRKSDDIDVTALADEAGGDDAAEQASHAGRIPEGGFAMGADLHQDPSPEDDFEFGAAEADDDENKPIETAGVETDAEPGLFDPNDQKEDAMSMDNQDLPTSHMDSEAPTQLGVGAAAVGADMDSSVAQLVQEFERRLAHMEARLDESNEARERLERQVEAQAEELRVQRAAIARTQRAVRSLNRPDEDQATEPALRDPSTPTS